MEKQKLQEYYLIMMRRITISVLILFILAGSILAQDKRKIALLPFFNEKPSSRNSWMAFGLEYYLRNKLSVLSGFYLPEKKVLKKVLDEVGFGKAPLNEQMIYRIGRYANVEMTVSGSFFVENNLITLKILYSNAYNGTPILSSQFRQPVDKFFELGNQVIEQLISLTGIPVSATEKRLLSFTLTNSVSAFESFIRAYMENSKPNARIEKVTGLFRQAIQKDPEFWEAYYNLGIVYFNAQKYTKALEQFNKVINALPNFSKPYYGRGLIFIKQGAYDKALKDFERVKELNPNDYQAYYYIGRVLRKQKKFVEAEKALKKASEINPDFAPTFFEWGNIYYDKKNFRKAIEYYRNAAELNPKNSEYHLRLGDCYYRSQIFYSALNELNKSIELQPDNPYAYFLKGLTIYKQAVIEELISAFLELLDAQNQSNADLVKVNKPRRRNSDITMDPIKKKQVYLDMAIAFTNAVKYKPDFKEAIFNLALTYHEMGSYDLAEKYYILVLTLDDSLLRVYLKLAELYTEIGKKDLALEQYRKIFYLNPAYIVKHPSLGPEFRYLNILDKFKKELEETLQKNPNDVRANLVLAKVFEAQGNYGKAANLARRVLAFNPQNKEAQKLLKSISQ
ncbi:Tetratricopeptide TPR_1 repeat-containing protein [Caldithrix abyssi DSM 13497]|uniref:Tetratricopeptide TPR_1 repeat-containing protein n=2 Tax=Caldithrix abyssi TaxID=187145 RepID=H1XSC4_CALAY|nr:Tetratricopeptide repeat-containing protein [Caldithrix abyssi DSM 13497]EHO41336.1 Tetratricopeptide TPR_1 repeat-containing protein [Caldithrix abyssi DSM 13497]